MDKAAPDPLAGLVEMPLPPAISLWPQTWELRAAITLLLVLLVTAAVWWSRRHIANRYRRAALTELDAILRRARDHALAEQVEALAMLVRRTALSAFPREQVVPLAENAWLAFLDRSYGGKGFTQGPGQVLGAGLYQPTLGTSDVGRLAGLVRQWIRAHHD